jgi:kojibiose phosphorylase
VTYLGLEHPDALRSLVRKIGIEDELPRFVEAFELLYVPAPDSESRIIEQFDGYFKLEDTTIEQLRARLLHPDEYLGGGQGLAVPTKVIKQADVVLMLNLFKDRYPMDVKRANWEYYEPLTEHGSSLSACAYAMVAAEIGNLEFAYKYFLKTAKIDIEAKYKVYVGTVFMGGSHPAANGGAWMTAVFGFGGLAASEKLVSINPRLYKTWKKLQFNLAYKGDRFNITISNDCVEVVAAQTNKSKQTFLVTGRAAECAPGESILVKCSNERTLLCTQEARCKAE